MNRGKPDPMQGLLSSVGGIDANLFNKPSMAQMKKSQGTGSKAASGTASPQQSAASPQAIPAPSQTSGTTQYGRPQQPAARSGAAEQPGAGTASGSKSQGLGFLDSDFDRLFGGAAKPQAASMSNSAAASPMVTSRAASNELEVNDHDFLGSFSSSRSAGPPSQPQRAPQPRSRQAADPFADSGSLQAVPAHQQPADPFAEPGSSMPARQVPGQQAGTDDFLDMFQGAAAAPSGARPGAAAAPTGGGDDDLLGGFAGSLGVTRHEPPQIAGRHAGPVPSVGSADDLAAFASGQGLPERAASSGGQASPGGASLREAKISGLGQPRASAVSLDSTTAVQGSPAQSRSSTPGLASPARGADSGAPPRYRPTPERSRAASPGSGASSVASSMGLPAAPNTRQPAEVAGGSRLRARGERPPAGQRDSREEGTGGYEPEGPLERGRSGGSGEERHPDPYAADSGKAKIEDTATQLWSSSSKWLRSAGKKLASAAKESATQLQTKLETIDPRFAQKGPRTRIGDDGEEIPAYYYEWASQIQAMPASKQPGMLQQLSEDDRAVVEQILGKAASSTEAHSPGAARPSSFRQQPSAIRGSEQQRPVSPPPPPADPPARSAPGKVRTAADLGLFDVADSGPQEEATRDERPRRHSFHESGSGAGARPRAGAAEQPQQQATQQQQGLGSDQAGAHATATAGRQQPPRQQRPAEPDLLGGHPAAGRQHERPAERPAEADLLGGSEPAPASVAAAGAGPSADLLGGFEAAPSEQRASASPQQAARKPAQRRAAAPAAAADADFLGVDQRPQAAGAGAMDQQPVADSADGLADFFSGGAADSAGAAAAASTSHIEDIFNASPARRTAPAPAASASSSGQAAPRPAAPAKGSMIDMEDQQISEEATRLAADPAFAQKFEDVPGEPPLRRQLRLKRLAEMHVRMAHQLEEKQARDVAEASEKEQKVDLRNSVVKPRIEAWTAGKKDNIRALLSTVHTVLWEGSGWTPPGMTDLVEAGKVKRQYMKVNLIIHPDKVKQKGGTVEQVVIADMAFDVLKVAWGKFEATELRK